jgi:glycosyltransferase involved in cell wall biosynthesis
MFKKPATILFLKKKGIAGIQTYQDNILHIISNSPHFRLILLDEEINNENKIINVMYRIANGISILKIGIIYIYLLKNLKNYREKVDYFFIPHHFKYGLLGIIASYLFDLPFITTMLGWSRKELELRRASRIETFIRLKYEEWVLKKARFVLSCDDIIDEYVKIIPKDEKFISLDCPVDLDIFRPIPRSENLIKEFELDNKKVILTVTSLEGVKAEGLKILLKAFIKVKKEYKNVILLIAGDGPRRNEFEELILAMNEKNDIKLLGFCNNIPSLINSSDIFVLLFPFGGGIGSAIKEAMACEKPCVISKTSGTKQLRDGEEVLLVGLEPNEVSDKIIFLLRNEKFARELGINARKRVEKDFSMKRAEEILTEKLIKKMNTKR